MLIARATASKDFVAEAVVQRLCSMAVDAEGVVLWFFGAGVVLPQWGLVLMRDGTNNT